MIDSINEFTRDDVRASQPTDGRARERMLAKRSIPARDRQASADRLALPSAGSHAEQSLPAAARTLNPEPSLAAHVIAHCAGCGGAIWSTDDCAHGYHDECLAVVARQGVDYGPALG